MNKQPTPAQRLENSAESTYITTVKIGAKGQIVIPKEIRARCGISPGESLLLISPEKGGFMAQPLNGCRDLLSHLLEQIPSAENPS